MRMYRCVYCLTSTRETDGPIPEGAHAAHPECTKKLLDAMVDDPARYWELEESLQHDFDTVEGQRELWVALFGPTARG